MMSAERGAAANTISAYGRDLADYLGVLARKGKTIAKAGKDEVDAYIAGLGAEGLAASSVERRSSAVRQFHRFLVADAIKRDDPTRILSRPKTRRALPRVM